MSNALLPEPRVTLVYRLEATLGQPLDLGERPQGHRRIVPLVGGTFNGPGLSGKLLQRDRRPPCPDGQLESVTLIGGERLRFSFLFLFLGAMPCTEWLGDAGERDEDGFIVTGSGATGEKLLETSVPGILSAGDVRAGSTKRCATAVGEGAWAVQLVHAHLAAR